MDAGILRALVGRRRSPERLQRCGNFALLQSVPGVAHPQYHLSEIGQRGGNDDLPASLGEMNGVADQVLRDLTQSTDVGDDRRQPLRQRGTDDDALAIGLWLHHRYAGLDEFVEV